MGKESVTSKASRLGLVGGEKTMKLARWEMLKVCVLFLRSNNSAILKETKGSVPNQSLLQELR